VSLVKLSSREHPDSFLRTPFRCHLTADKSVLDSAASPMNRSSVQHRAGAMRPIACDLHEQPAGSENRYWRRGFLLCHAVRLVKGGCPY